MSTVYYWLLRYKRSAASVAVLTSEGRTMVLHRDPNETQWRIEDLEVAFGDEENALAYAAYFTNRKQEDGYVAFGEPSSFTVDLNAGIGDRVWRPKVRIAWNQHSGKVGI